MVGNLSGTTTTVQLEMPSTESVTRGATSSIYADLPPTNTREESDVFLESEDNPWEVTLQANDQPVTFNIDTGAEVTVISQKKHRNIGCPKLTNSDRRLKGPDSHNLTSLGYFTATLATETCKSQQRCMSSHDLIGHC